MSSPADLLLDGFGRFPELVAAAVEGLSEEQLTRRLDAEANTLAWLVWHLARVEDLSLAEAFGAEQVWLDDGWDGRFALPFGPDDIGYGHDPAQVAAVRGVSAELLISYYSAVSRRTAEHLCFVTGDDLDRVVDPSYDPPVTLGVRLVSVLEDVAQHAGQAAFLRGLITRS